MSATINFTVPTPEAGEAAAVSVRWYDSADGITFTLLSSSLLSALTEVDGVYSWTVAAADSSHYQQIKCVSAGGRESDFGAILPPMPSSAVLQTLFGTVKEFASAVWSVGDTVTMTIQRDTLENGLVLEPVVKTATVNANGLFTLTPDKGADVNITIAGSDGVIYFDKSFTVSDDDTKDIKDY
jgi:hypothetical protein